MLCAESGDGSKAGSKIWTTRYNRDYPFAHCAVTDVSNSTLPQYKECPNDEWNSQPPRTSDQQVSAAIPSPWSDDYPSPPSFVASGRAP